jgi:hypothetical protein
MAPSRLQSDVLSRRWSFGGVDRRSVFVVADFLFDAYFDHHRPGHCLGAAGGHRSGVQRRLLDYSAPDVVRRHSQFGGRATA